MAVHAPGAEARFDFGYRHAGATALALFAFGALLVVFEPTSVAAVQNFFLVFGSLLVEAIPFIALGALVSAGIEVFVPKTIFEKLASLPRPLQLPVSGLAGPPSPSASAGPFPWLAGAHRQGPHAVGGGDLHARRSRPQSDRHCLHCGRLQGQRHPVADGAGTSGPRVPRGHGRRLRRQRRNEGAAAEAALREGRAHDHSHDHEEGGRGRAFFGHLSGDFVFMGRFLVIGALIAAALQTFVPQSIIGGVANTPVLNLLAMMGLAFLLSLCSESDAFVAASFVQFGVGAQLAFLVFGPMVDTKLAILYGATFRQGFFRTVVVVVTAATLIGCLWLEVVFG
jgi:uncharacterized membrane protein YraQ (UPF0718 family)